VNITVSEVPNTKSTRIRFGSPQELTTPTVPQKNRPTKGILRTKSSHKNNPPSFSGSRRATRQSIAVANPSRYTTEPLQPRREVPPSNQKTNGAGRVNRSHTPNLPKSQLPIRTAHRVPTQSSQKTLNLREELNPRRRVSYIPITHNNQPHSPPSQNFARTRSPSCRKRNVPFQPLEGQPKGNQVWVKKVQQSVDVDSQCKAGLLKTTSVNHFPLADITSISNQMV